MHLLMGPQLTRGVRFHPQSVHGKAVAPSSESAECSPHPFARSSRPRPLAPQSSNNAKRRSSRISASRRLLAKQVARAVFRYN